MKSFSRQNLHLHSRNSSNLVQRGYVNTMRSGKVLGCKSAAKRKPH